MLSLFYCMYFYCSMSEMKFLSVNESMLGTQTSEKRAGRKKGLNKQKLKNPQGRPDSLECASQLLISCNTKPGCPTTTCLALEKPGWERADGIPALPWRVREGRRRRGDIWGPKWHLTQLLWLSNSSN